MARQAPSNRPPQGASPGGDLDAGLAWARGQALGRIPLFAGLSHEALASLAATSVTRRYRARQIIFHAEDAADALYVLVSGRVKVTVSSPDGEELMLAVVGEGEALGELGALDGMPRSATVETLTDSRLMRVDAAAVTRLIRDNPGVAEWLIRSLCGLVRRLTGMSADLAFLDVRRRLARLLLDLHDEGESVGGLGLTQSELAARIAAGRQAVNEALHELQRRGWIQLKRREIVIRDPQALWAYASGQPPGAVSRTPQAPVPRTTDTRPPPRAGAQGSRRVPRPRR